MEPEKEKLFIQKMDMSNVGRFYGTGHSIVLSDSSDKNITVIIGYSGRGKSTIHDLIYWCLYGEHKKHSEEMKELDYGLINVDALENMSKGDEVNASVTLSLYDGNGEKYNLTRELTATLNKESDKRIFNEYNNSQVKSGISFDTKVTLRTKNSSSGESETEKNPRIIDNTLNQYFPKELSDFFLFDGENLLKFQNRTSADFIRNGITKISGLEILRNLSESAIKTEKSINKHIGGKSVEVAPHQINYDRTEGKINTINEAINKLGEEITQNQTFYEQIIKKIEQNKYNKDLLDLQKQADANKTKAMQELNKTNGNLRDMIFEKTPQLLLHDTLKKSEEIFARLENEEKIPPSISRSAIDKILQTYPLKCVCGREFEKNENKDSPWMTLNKIKDDIIEDGLAQGISLGRDLISRIIDTSSINNTRTDYHDLVQLRRTKRNDIEKYKSESENYDRKLQGYLDTGDDLISEKTKYWEAIHSKTAEKIDKESDLEDKKRELGEYRKLRDTARHKGERFDVENKKIGLAVAVDKFAKKLEKRIEEELRNKTENTTSDYFMQSAPQKEDFDCVKIRNNYDIIVKDSNDLSANLSKGQAHVLGLSYVAGIREITHTNTFLIIDSPLHNISGIPRNDISDVFSKYLPGVQLVLLVTDTEYLQSDPNGADPVKRILREHGRVWKEYFIHDVETETGIKSRSIREYSDDDDV